MADNPLSGEFAPSLTVRTGTTERILPPGPSYLVGRDPECDIVITDTRVSWRHAVLSLTGGRWVLADNGSTNGTFADGRRMDRIEITGPSLIRLGHAADGPPMDCTVGVGDAGQELREFAPAEPNAARSSAASPPAPSAPAPHPVTERVPVPPATAPADGDGPLEIPYAVRWLVPRGERFANFDILNDNDSQIEYYRRFGHIYAVGIPTKKWRLVVVSDPVLLDEVAANEEQFGKRVEEINFFAQLGNSRGGGISVIGDGEHYDQIRRVMLPWYAPSHQRTQLERMKDQARKLVADWSAIPAGTTLEARTWMERYALEVSGRGACAYDFGLLGRASQQGHGDAHPFAAAVPASTKESIRRVADPRPDSAVFAGRTARQRRQQYRRHNQELYKTAGALVQARLHGAPLGQQTDLLSRLVSTPDPETGQLLDAETIRDQILMHLSNGFNGPSITGAWLAYLLATHPDVEAKLIAEIDGITGGDPDYDLQYADLFNLTYTTQVIKETMRIYPPQPVTIRRSLKDGTLGRYRVRKDDIILVGTLAAQRDPHYWGPDPDRFDPEQFALEKVVDRPRHAFIPFSVGKRQCMAQEVTFMMLRVVLFEIYRHFQLRLAPGAKVIKNTVVTTKPAEVPIIVVPRQRPRDARRAAPVPRAQAVSQDRPRAVAAEPGRDWGDPTQIPETSAYGHLVIAYGSNFGANKMLAERFAERADFQGYTSDVIPLNELDGAPPRTRPWLLVAMTSTYTSNPPSNAAAFKAWLERTPPGTPTWQNCRYLIWGLGNSQWNAFLAFPRYLYAKLSELGATPLGEFAYGDVGTPVWERRHDEWNAAVWPVLLELSGARRTQAAAARVGPASPLRAAIDAGGYDVLRLLYEFPSCPLNIYEFLQVAQPLKPRYYSTSSSPRIHGDGVAHVTVGLETAPVPGRPGRDFVGLSSHYVHALRKGDRLNVFIESADGFHLQDDLTKPMILVCVGTGFAPMRAFCWERLALRRAGVPLGEAALFNGIRSSRLDYIYREEIERFAADGVLDHVYVATSRERPDRRDYVQDHLREQGALVWRLLTRDGYVYVCGSRPMREAVRAALVDVIADHGALPRERAEAYLADMETTARYRPDLWG